MNLLPGIWLTLFIKYLQLLILIIVTYCSIFARKKHVDIYFPGVSAEVSALVKRWDDFKRIGVTLSVSNSNSVDVANNKLKTYQMLAEAGIPVPEYYPVHTINDFVEGCKYMGYPQKLYA